MYTAGCGKVCADTRRLEAGGCRRQGELKVSGTFFAVRRSVQVVVVIPSQIGRPFLDYARRGQVD